MKLAMKRRINPFHSGPTWFLGMTAFLFLSVVVGLTKGPVGWLSLGEIFHLAQSSLTNTFVDEDERRLATVLWHLRLPRVVLAMLVGANLAVAGVLMQALFYNPLAEPYVAGVSSGAAFGAVLAITLGLRTGWGGLQAVSALAFAGATLTTFLVYRIALQNGRISMAGLLLTGIAMSGLLHALTALLILQSNPYQVRSVLDWLMGSLAFRNWTYVGALLPYSLIGWSLAWRMHRVLNALATGDESAHYLGIPLRRSQFLLLAVAALLAGSAVAAVGIIAFVGLLVPHLVRMTLGANHRLLLPGSLLAGGVFLIWSDVLARNLAAGQEIPIGIVTAVMGCLFFIYLLKQNRGRVF